MNKPVLELPMRTLPPAEQPFAHDPIPGHLSQQVYSAKIAEVMGQLGNTATDPEVSPQDTLGELAQYVASKAVLFSGSNSPIAERATSMNERADNKEHFVKIAPRFAEQVADVTRTNTFKYVQSPYTVISNGSMIESSDVREVDEHAGLVELQEFLERVSVVDGVLHNSKLPAHARSMLENLTFIGKKEYDEAAKGLGEMWKAYLDADPRNHLCVPLEISRFRNVVKSDTNLFENILMTFSDEELERYKGRISNDPKKLTEDPEYVTVAFLDDWTISGSQMRRSARDLASELTVYKGSFEVHLIVASEPRLKHGFSVNMDYHGRRSILLPVKSYFKAHTAELAVTSKVMGGDGTHITGTHSSVDFDFENTIYDMAQLLTSVDHEKDTTTDAEDSAAKRQDMPPLTNIIRAYRGAEPRVFIEEDGTITRLNQLEYAN